MIRNQESDNDLENRDLQSPPIVIEIQYLQLPEEVFQNTVERARLGFAGLIGLMGLAGVEPLLAASFEHVRLQ